MFSLFLYTFEYILNHINSLCACNVRATDYKKMATHIKLTLDTRRKNTKIFPLIFRLSHNRKTTSIATGYNISPSNWDEKKREIKLSFKGTDSPTRLNNLLLKRKAYMVDVLTKLEDKGQLKYLSVSEVRHHITQTINQTTFYNYCETLIKEMIEAKRIGNARVYQHTLNAIKNFRKNRDFSFDELNTDFLYRFERWHLSKGNTLGGLSVYLRTVRAINRKAIKTGIADLEGYAFKDYVIRSSKPQKRAVSIEAIRKVWNLELKVDTILFIDRNIFIMSFLLNGMSYVDLANLKLANIIDGRIKYIRQKTNEPYDIKIHEQLNPLLTFFTEGKKKNDYILPIIKRKNDIDQYKDIEWARKRFNKNLKILAKKAEIEENLTSYVTRHSFASGADDMGIPVTAISKMLGHKRISTTQVYLASLRNSKMDEYQDEIINKLSSK